ncbi:MAG: hypothetical protein IJM36_03450, partial [Acholeplasmatales bacterium]|nr:hypothetical protein [Acholeplasmatales bacterium]
LINYNGKTIIIATYKRAKILKIKDEEVIIKQGKYRFTVKLIKKNSFDLKAPKLGQMDRIIKESAECVVSYCIFRIIPARHLGNCRPLPKGR